MAEPSTHTGSGPRLILASGSAARRAMLTAAAVPFSVVPANIDEDAITAEVLAARRPGETDVAAAVASRLACDKACAVARADPDALVIGSDQVLALDQQLITKSPDRAAARRTLQNLRGRSHTLTSAVALAQGGTVLWHTFDRAELTMRAFSDAYLDAYLDAVGDAVLRSVGCYELEGRGVQLFARISGDYFTILGMPLLELLARLREHHGVLPS